METCTQVQEALALTTLTSQIQKLSEIVSGLTAFIPPTLPAVVVGEGSHERHGAHEDRNPKRRKVSDSMAASMNLDSHKSWSPSIFSSPERLNTLADAYFSNVHPWIPMIHRSTFKKSMQNKNTGSNSQTILKSMFIAALPFVEDGLSFSTDTQGQVERAADQVLLTASKSLALENLQALTVIAFTYVRLVYFNWKK